MEAAYASPAGARLDSAGVAQAMRVVAETDALVKGAGRDPAYALERAVIEIVAARGRR